MANPTKIEEDLAEFRTLDQRLLEIAQARNTTATELLEASDRWATWTRFAERTPQRIRDIDCLEKYLNTIDTGHIKNYPRSKLWTGSTVKAAKFRILEDQHDLLIMLASIDDTRHVY